MALNLFRRQWAASVFAGVAVVFPVILSVDRYIDDIDRSMNGRMNWDRAGRPLADLLFSVANFGKPGVAVAPLYTLVAIVLLALAGVFAARCYGIRSPFWVAIATLPLIAQPYGLQNLSYGFDALGMAAALALAVIAACLVQRGKNWRLFGGGVMALVASLSLYQPGASGFIPSAGFLAIAAGLGLLASPWNGMSMAGRLCRSTSAYVAALVLYRWINWLWFESRLSSYAADGSRLKTFTFDGFQALLHDLVNPWIQIIGDFGRWPVVAPLLLLLLSCFLLIIRLHKPGAVVLCVISTIAIALLSPGALLLLRDSFLYKPRVMAFLGPLLMSAFLIVSSASPRVGWPLLRWSVVPMAWLFVVFSYAYGHSFAAQASFEQMRISRIVGEVTALQVAHAERPIRRVAVTGVMPRSPVLQNTVDKFPLIDRLIPPLLADNWTFGISQLNLYGLPLERVELSGSWLINEDLCKTANDVVCTSEFQLQIFDEDVVLIRLL